MKAQTIQIDSIFTSDGEIFPFSSNDTIYGLSISGSVVLHSDTSLVRVILTDINGQGWMVYEAYPMIVADTAFDFVDQCDETCYLEESYPNSIEIQIIDAELEISHLSMSDNYFVNLADLQHQAKSEKDLQKVQFTNQYIAAKGWGWIVDANGLSKLFYSEKKQVFGNKYNLLGRDYYIDGVYYSILHEGIPSFRETSIISCFDWREKHNAHLDNSFYYGGEGSEPDNGWMTGMRDQGDCGTCGTFSTLATFEAVINLYSNYQFDIEEAINFSEKDAYNCSYLKTVQEIDYVGCENCLDGKGISKIMKKLREEGVVNESCHKYEVPICEGFGLDCSFSSKCSDPIMTAHLCHEKVFTIPVEYDQEERAAFLKEIIINNGPLSVNIYNWPHKGGQHAVSLIGFDLYNGQIVWTYKNSHGIDFGKEGYGKETFWLGQFVGTSDDPTILEKVHAINFDDTCAIPIEVICHQPNDCSPNFNYYVHDLDVDQDGYYNWGIGPRIKDHPPCYVEEEDSNDDDNRIGPFEEDYSGKPVKPIMNVTAQVGTSSPVPITNHGFFFIQQNPEIITVNITNSGNAQLNLAALLPVTIIEEGHTFFSLLHDEQPESTICMEGDKSSFGVHFDTSTPFGPEGLCMATIKIQLASCDSDIYDYFEFAVVYQECEFNEEMYYVDGYEAINGYQVIQQDIYIEDEGILEIFGSVAMHDESDIFVGVGGQLILNGGLITSSCSNTLWNGIDIWGNVKAPQTLEYQGKVSVINGGCIEYALKAIETGHLPDPRRYSSGGIVSCVDAVFKDNVTDIILYPFRNIVPNGPEIPNFCRFKRTKFMTTDDFYTLFDLDLNTHLLFDGVSGINVMGCTFENNSTLDNVIRGKGIESYSAGYFIFKSCTQDNLPECPGFVPCRFENLDYGIRALNSNSYGTIKVDSVDFIHNLRGMHLILVQNPTIIRSTFEVSDPEGFWPGDDLVGLYLDQFTTGFVVEENAFIGTGTFSSAVGIHLLNTGTEQNEIYNNSFSSLYHGISAVGVNRLSDKESEGAGLCIKCNDFEQCRNDIYVTCETDGQGNEICTANSGIAQKQGLMNESEPPHYNTLAAGNTFSDVNSANFFNNEHCGQIEYTYHRHNNSPMKIIPEPFSGIDPPEPDPFAYYSKIGSCPSHLGGSIALAMEKTTLTTETNLISAYEDTLLMTIDGGNTEGLNFEVITSFPDESLVIRQELIDESPFLSDTVMISAIEKEEVLPGAMIRDVLVQNPHAPKSKKIMDALDQRQDTIPDYMREEILQGISTYGAKELLEQELGHHISERDQAWKNLNLFYKNDTSNISCSIDSLMELQENENRLSARYDLAFMHLYVEDSINAFTVLNNISSEFDLNSEEAATQSHYVDLFNILWDIKHDTTGLDSLQIQTLFDLADSYQTLPGLYASNLLIKERLLNYDDPVYLADPVKNIPVQNKIQEAHTDIQQLILFPNPAGTYFIAYYFLNEDQYPGMLTFSDINGIELKSFQLKDKQNQIVIPSQDLSAGVYMVSLIGRNHLIESQKITIIK